MCGKNNFMALITLFYQFTDPISPSISSKLTKVLFFVNNYVCLKNKCKMSSNAQNYYQ